MDVNRHLLFHCVALLVLFLVCILPTSANSWIERKKSHKTRTLRDDKLQVIAQMCDSPDRTAYFKDSILKPFLIERVSDTEGNRIVREHIKQMMTQMGWQVEEDSFVDKTPYGDKTFVNIIARQNPKATRHLTLACHYDSKMIPGVKFIGATDSAVPCAIMIDVAGLLSQSMSRSTVSRPLSNQCSRQDMNSDDCQYQGHHTDLTLQLLFFDGEEAFVQWTETDSLYGARHLASKMANNLIEVEREVLVNQIETIDAFVLLDLIGTADTQFANWFSKTLPLYKTFKKIEGRLSAAGLLQVNAGKAASKRYFTDQLNQNHEVSGGIQDDHIPFLRRGVPVVHLISNPFPSVWHLAADNEAALHYPTINDIRKIVTAFVVEYMHLTHLNE